ncbi:hypothetical protein C9I57_18665 [Trinickia symbiotica]|uniref:Apea-like HEPN domain-containing protein n=1 Tax=Trinickia symbiotica TaxID=863227 RepID=A0A2T3XRK5_9BURK|nr:hypothetical protein [Trinickia symbiotica]PTB19082.1 hypothetical protein C9I57_18665 [Trinickia symbiotica]
MDIAGYDISCDVGVGRFNDVEIAHCIAAFLPASSGHADEILYKRDNDSEWVIKLIYKKHRLRQVVSRMPEFELHALKTKIQEELEGACIERIGQTIMFSRMPTRGYFKIDSDLQILPVPPGSPLPSFFAAPHPFICQFRFKSSMLHSLNVSRMQSRCTEVALILNLLLQFGIIHTNRISHQWITKNQTSEGRISFLAPELVQMGYMLDGFQGQLESFSEPGALKALAEQPAESYYREIGPTVRSEMEVATNTAELFRIFMKLSGESREKFVRAIFWYRQADRLAAASASSAYLALIISIDALLPKQRGPACPTCGLSQGKSATDAFVEFMDRYSPNDSEFERSRKEFYRARSRLAHGGVLADDLSSTTILHPEDIGDWLIDWGARPLVRLALIAWLSECGQSETG